ncbi:MAG: hypothetical protein GY696_37205 [Gammaproteobacteria bacterium]|nr:hypothetical protein [Gammaproteobacteria bacterium]
MKNNFGWIIQALNFTGVALFEANATDLNFFVNVLSQWDPKDILEDPRFRYLRTQIVFAIVQNRRQVPHQAQEIQLIPPAILRRQPPVHSPAEMSAATAEISEE